MTKVDSFITAKIRDFFEYTIAGEWGSEGNSEIDTPVLRSTNFTNKGKIDYSDLAYRKIDSSFLSRKLVNKETILIEKSGGSPSQPAGRVVYCEEEFIGSASNFIEIAKTKNLYCAKYVFFLLHYLYQTGLILKYQQQTTGIINFKLEQYKDEEVLFASDKKEQEKIAEVLSTIDLAIAQTEAIIAKQQRIKTGLMQDLLIKGIDENGNIRSEATHEFKDSAIGRIPVEWEVENFIDACERVSVGIATSTTKYFQSEGVPLLRNQNILSGVFDLNELLYISLYFDVINKSKRLKTGDLVTMRTGYPGRTAVTTSFMDGWQTFTTLISTPKKQKYRPDFLSVLMNSFVCRKQILTLQGGGAQQNLNVGWLIKMKVFKPSIAEQTGILSVLNDIDKAIDCNSKQLQKLHHQKTGLMQDLLTGKVRVTNLLNQKAAAN